MQCDKIHSKLLEIDSLLSGIQLGLSTATNCDISAIAELFKMVQEDVNDAIKLCEKSDSTANQITEILPDAVTIEQPVICPDCNITCEPVEYDDDNVPIKWKCPICKSFIELDEDDDNE